MFLVGILFIVDDVAVRPSLLRLSLGIVDDKISSGGGVSVVPYHHRHPNFKIVVNVGMPRSGTTSFMNFIKALFHDKSNNKKYIHGYRSFSNTELAEYLSLGNESAVDNRILSLVTPPPETMGRDNNSTTLVRAVSDFPAFLLAPKAMDFPHVYWVQVTRDVEDHVDSTLYMIQKWMESRCNCPDAPRCKSAMDLVDRLYYNKYGILEHFCRNNKNASAIPRDLVRKLVTKQQEQTANYLKDHPHYLHYALEEDDDVKLEKLAHFLGLGTEALPSATNVKKFNNNQREFEVP